MSTTKAPVPATPPPRLGEDAAARRTGPARRGGRWSVALRWTGDATSVVLLAAVLWWLAYHDGGREVTAIAAVGIVGLLAVPAAVGELRRVPASIGLLVMLWAGGLVTSLLFAAERSGFAPPIIAYALVPVVGLSALRLWRRRWGPPAVTALLLVSFGLYWSQAFVDWWGQSMLEGRRPVWRPLSWHNQAGTLMVALGLFFSGVALTGRRLVAAATGLCAAAAFAGAWLSGSRGTLVAMAIGVVVLCIAAAAARGWPTMLLRAVALALASIAVVSGLLGFAGVHGDGAVTRVTSASGGTAEQHLFGRLEHMEAALGMFVDAPLTGQGIGSYREMARPFTSPDSNLTSSAHNEYAELLGEGGLFAAVPFLGLTAVALVVARRRLRGARRGLDRRDGVIGVDDLRWPLSIGGVGVVAALLVHQGADFDWSFPVIPALLAIAIAMTGHDVGPGAERSDRRPRLLPIGTAVLLALLLTAGSVGVFWQNRASQQRPGLSTQELARAPAAWDADQASHVASDLLRVGAYDEARWTLQRAVAWNPGYHPVRVDLAIVEYESGEITGRELVDVLDAHHRDFASSNQVAGALISAGDHALAQSLLEALLDTYPRYEAWGVDASRADTWYLLVRSAVEDDGCAAAQRQAAAARQAHGMDDPAHLGPIERLVEATCQ